MNAEEVESALIALAGTISGLKGIVITDRDGVQILSAVMPHSQSEPAAPQGSASRSVPIEAGFAIVADQLSKLQFGKCQHVLAMYDNKVVVHVNMPPLVLSLLVEDGADVEAVISVIPQLQTALSPVQQVVSAS
eukprot:CAMPEP_0196729678 /NCGR_PEP_ID=MMETSP1091-20130531/9997_1 /TAXON_ID=302021 /ORGANISM="Rhodomonas sp., Strain CCMP768" /LENGTH=133 /DNA_ID=CAMNT_0042072591 /DNA_START=8 /DNA_END=409 /DNA_ORIENTATION=+